MARPTKYTAEAIEQIRQAMDAYIEATPIPIIAEFAYQNKVPRQTLYLFAEENSEFSDTIKELIDKKEANLERMALNKEIEKTMAIFSLKQLGWKDKNETEHTGTVGISIIDDVKQCKTA